MSLVFLDCGTCEGVDCRSPLDMQAVQLVCVARIASVACVVWYFLVLWVAANSFSKSIDRGMVVFLVRCSSAIFRWDAIMLCSAITGCSVFEVICFRRVPRLALNIWHGSHCDMVRVWCGQLSAAMNKYYRNNRYKQAWRCCRGWVHPAVPHPS